MKRALLILLCVGCATSGQRRREGAEVLDRSEFNRIAQELYLPLFWISDANPNGRPDPEEVAILWGYGVERSEYVALAGFTPKATDAIDTIRHVFEQGHDDDVSSAEAERRGVVRKELSQGRPTLLLSRFESPEDRAVVGHIRDAAEHIERLYALQTGAAAFWDQIPESDPSSRALFHRNQGPWCEAPLTEANPRCSALPDKPKKKSGLYPSSRNADDAFCAALAADEQLADHFSAISERAGALVAVPYSDFFADEMTKVAVALRKAADALGPSEQAFAVYLRTAEAAFLNNKWSAADEAWARMSATNSRWYLRIGPDETYFEPCNQKAGFHASFAKINPASLEWQSRLDALKNDMELAIAAMAGPPYAARTVDFHLPDFIDIVLNAGDSRSAIGATIGQSLPNWGPVANEGRGRTVAMTNLDSDPDSVRSARETSSSLLCPKTMGWYTDDPSALLMSTVLHEAAHNLGPAHEYKVGGKTDEELFGGPLSSTLEELKAQTAAMFYADWLVDRQKLTRQEADRTHLKDLTWIFGQISRGMTTAEGQPKSYSQLSAVQLGVLMRGGAVSWMGEPVAANGTDKGCFEVDFGKMKPAVEELMRTVAEIKGRGEKARAEALLAEHVNGETSKLFPVITERLLRAPRASFVYAIDVGE